MRPMSAAVGDGGVVGCAGSPRGEDNGEGRVAEKEPKLGVEVDFARGRVLAFDATESLFPPVSESIGLASIEHGSSLPDDDWGEDDGSVLDALLLCLLMSTSSSSSK